MNLKTLFALYLEKYIIKHFDKVQGKYLYYVYIYNGWSAS